MPAGDEKNSGERNRPLPELLWVFDGYCGFCSASVLFVLKRDREKKIHFVSIQSPAGQRIALSNGLNPDDPSSFLFIEKGKAWRSGKALVALAGHLPWPWRAFVILRILPARILDAIYVLVARNRYRLMGRRQTCFVSQPEHRERFLDGE